MIGSLKGGAFKGANTGASTTFTVDTSSDRTRYLHDKSTEAERFFAIYERLFLSQHYDSKFLQSVNQIQFGIHNNQYNLSYLIEELLRELYINHTNNNEFAAASEVKLLLHELGKAFKIEDFVQLVISSKTVSVSSEKNLLSTIPHVHDDFNHGVTQKNIDRTKIIRSKEKTPEQAISQNLIELSVPTTSKATPIYCQKNCPTLTPFINIRKKHQVIGQDAVEKLKQKSVPSGKEVRVDSKKMPGVLLPNTTRGLHEIVPTDQVERLARLEIEKLRHDIAEILSGARTSTALTMFNQCKPEFLADPNKQIVAHNGVFHPATRHTGGQADAHEQLRIALWEGLAIADLSGSELLIHMVNKQLEISVRGKKIMVDVGITGELSVLTQIGMISEPLGRSRLTIIHREESQRKPLSPEALRAIDELLTRLGLPLRPEPVEKTNRAKFAILNHEAREGVKDRVRALKRRLYPHPGPSPDGRTRSPSPSRTPLTVMHRTTYTGGDYEEGYERPLPEIPTFPTLADESAWVTAPQRLGFTGT